MNGFRRLRVWYGQQALLIWLVIATLMLTTGLSIIGPAGTRAFQSDSPTATPVPTATPLPTATPVPTATPLPTATPIPTDTPPPTAPPVSTATPPPVTTLLPTATPPLPEPLPTLIPPPAVISPTAILEPLPTPTMAPGAGITVTEPTTAVAATTELASAGATTDRLVKLIDTFVLYTAYFLLGCGLIAFVSLAVGFFYLHRRAQRLTGSDRTPR